MLTFLDFAKACIIFGGIRNFTCSKQPKVKVIGVRLKVIGFGKLQISQKTDHSLMNDNRVDSNTLKKSRKSPL